MKSFLIDNKLTGLKKFTTYKKDVLKIIKLFESIKGKKKLEYFDIIKKIVF